MAIVQTIEFKIENKYFAGFLQAIVDECEIEGSVELEDGIIKLTLDSKESEKLTEFSRLSDKYLPHSMFIGNIDTKVEDVEIQKSHFKSKPYNISLCPKCLEEVTNPASEFYLDDSYVCKHYSNDEAFYDNDSTFFTPHYTPGCAVLLTDSSKVDELFTLTDKEKQTLFSIEKATIKATIKSDELKSLTDKNYIYLKAPYNTRSTLFALNAKDSEIPYIFFQDSDDLKVIKVQDNTTIIRAKRVAKELESFDSDAVLNRFLNIKKEACFSSAIGASLSTKHGILFIASTKDVTKKVIEFNKFDSKKLLETMEQDEIRAKLLSNFEKKYPKNFQKLKELQTDNLFEVINIILEIDNSEYDAFELLSDKSLEFRGNGGLKIDMNFDGKEFDYSAMVGSIISFVLAGADTHYIAYSIFEAYGDMVISTLNQLKTKLKIPNFVMMGDMFGNSVLYSRILSKFQLSNPYFSSCIALDD